MKKARTILLAAVFLCLAIALAGCASKEVRKEAKQYKKAHKKEFVQAVQNEMGNDYALSNVKGKLEPYGNIFTVGYTAEHVLTGNLKEKSTGMRYKASYDFDTDVLYTNAYTDEVFNSLVDALKIDKSKIIYRASHETNNPQYQLPAYIHTIEGALKEKRDICYYIVTTEDMDNYDFSEYMDLCKRTNYCCSVNILSSDDFQNMETFQKEYETIGVGENRVTMYYNGRDTDVIYIFNLKKYVFINKRDQEVGFSRYDGSGLEYTTF